ncbi:sugar diacid recognition domain-containing protein [Vibrio sp. CK2-1]|uniref:sugar diacid recognition domain-containing protein n=1 Tax=Vibrio sp. CK2-1 TaxID=2912249 RepID=UPI001F24F121|nr:sugar diacid recognition domain-containing protein [Vibrio sp. CK2-1]MCF7354036.1 helix-turn-helix domain-containing protein [Vibrio sp. CK2-1]
MYLDTQLAQQIVDRTMAIIDTNINVMNDRGIIISSGEPERIGQLHDGALLAIQHGDTTEITQQTSQNLKGVKPGINLVLKHDDTIIGVVGITGNPDEIRNYAALVKMTSEMIIERSLLIEQLQWDKRHIEEFISSWVNNELTKEALESWAQRLSIDIEQPRVAVLIEISESSNRNQLDTIRKIVELLEYPERSNLVAVVAMNQILVLKPCQQAAERWDYTIESKRIDQLIHKLQQHDIHQLHIALGEYFPSVMDMPLSFQSAQQVLTLGKHYQPKQTKYLFEDLRMPVLLSPLKENWQGAQLCNAIVKLKSQDRSGQLIKTLYSLFEHQGNLSQCANSLYIHRNTLRYRLNKIESITQISPHNFTGLVELYIACQITQ